MKSNKTIRIHWFIYFLIGLAIILLYSDRSIAECDNWYCEPQEHIENTLFSMDGFVAIRSDMASSASASGYSGYSGNIVISQSEIEKEK